MKKAEITWQIIIFMALGIIVLIVSSTIFTGTARTTGKELNKHQLKLRFESCKLEGLRQPGPGDWDLDNDGFPNSCETCVGGDDDQNSDTDGLPDECDSDKLKNVEQGKYKESCNLKGGKWNSKTNQCCLTSNSDVQIYCTGNDWQ